MNATRTPTSAQRLARFIAELPAAAIPKEVLEHGKLCLLDTVACGLFGAGLAPARILAGMLAETTNGGPAQLWGHRLRLSPADAALVNGTAIHGFELDDLHPRSIVHPGSVVTSAAAAIAAVRPGLSGADFLASIVLGYETAARVGSTMGAAHLLAGWHPTGTHGTFGAAVAAGRVLGLDAAQLADAIGNAGSQSGGLMAAQYESMTKRFHAGRAAQSGVYSALLGARGYTGIRDVFEAGYGGYLGTFSPASDPTRLLDGLGERWETLAVGFKPYSTNGSCHPSIDCLLDLFHSEGVRRDAVESVEIGVSTATYKHVGWPYFPDSVTTAQMNLPYIVAVVLTDGAAFVDQFAAGRIADPALVEFAHRVHVTADPAVDALGDGGRHHTTLTVRMRDGREYTRSRGFAHGSARDPLSEHEVRRKFRDLAGRMLPPTRVDQLEAVIGAIDTAPELGGFLALLEPPG